MKSSDPTYKSFKQRRHETPRAKQPPEMHRSLGETYPIMIVHLYLKNRDTLFNRPTMHSILERTEEAMRGERNEREQREREREDI